jgi:hypothetical protein
MPKMSEASDTNAVQFSTLAQPGFSSVFLLRYFSCAVQNFFVDLELTTIGRKRLRKFFHEISIRGGALNAALLQQTATGTALRRPGDLAAVDHYVGANRIREAVVATGADRGSNPIDKSAGVSVPGYNCLCTNSVQRFA